MQKRGRRANRARHKNGATISSAGGIGTVPATWSIVQTGDYDGDGKTDLLWRDTSGMIEAGLDAQIDGIANVFGRSRARGRVALAGSHIESQNQAGWLDGALGVIYALEAARALRDDPAMHDVGIDVIAFCDEEGHFGSYLGSRSFIGDVTILRRAGGRRRTLGKVNGREPIAVVLPLPGQPQPVHERLEGRRETETVGDPSIGKRSG
jgi:beta-ureidopropionase / N-carbamoyl-L-amino-acid hydrolase